MIRFWKPYRVMSFLFVQYAEVSFAAQPIYFGKHFLLRIGGSALLDYLFETTLAVLISYSDL